MPFKPGAPGRPKGSPNKRSLEVKQILAEAGHNPIERLMYLSRVAEARFEAETEAVNTGRFSPMECNAHAYLKMAIDANKELASFITPKLKAIEQITTNPTADMSPEQRLDAMKQAVKFLEAQVKGERGSSAT